MSKRNLSISKEKERINRRILCVGIFFGLLITAILSKAVYFQVFRADWLAQKAAREYEEDIVAVGKRGTVYDAQHRELAISIEVTSIAAYPAKINDVRQTASMLSDILSMDYRKIYHRLSSKTPFVWIKRQASPQETEEVKSLELAGIDFIPEYARFYPNKSLAAQVIGFTGIDGNGLEGLEYQFENQLRGEPSRITILKDALNRGFSFHKETRSDGTGNNIVLTIDRNIQYIAESALEEAVRNFEAKSGMAIVMDPSTGAVLAMAHYPRFNPNAFRKFSRQIWRNRAITDPYEPGSTMKIFSVTSAIESGICTPETVFYCEKGAYQIGEDTVHDTGSYGWLSLQKIIKYSSNIGAVKISEKIGPAALYNTLSDFGFGEKTNTGCPGETPGSLTSYKRWSKIDTGTIAFGHGISVSSIQLLTAVSAIANDGLLMRPYIIKSVTNPQGEPLQTYGPTVVRRVISRETARTVKEIMQTVIEAGGTGRRAALEGYTSCGKTGTSQKVSKSGAYSEEKYIGSFVGFAPADRPRISVLIVIDEPKNQYYGGIVAAPAFKRIAQQTLNYLNVPPDADVETLTASLMSISGG